VGGELTSAFFINTGYSVSDAGDVNGDGLDDIIVGVSETVIHGDLTGVAYVIFGRSDPINATTEPTTEAIREASVLLHHESDRIATTIANIKG